MARPTLLFLSAMFCLVIAGVKDELMEMVRSKTEQIFCGSKLADVLSLVCNGRYRAPDQNYGRRRRDSDDQLRTLEANNIYFPFLSKSIMANFMVTYGNHRRIPRGVYNDCCVQACSYEVLRSYCAD